MVLEVNDKDFKEEVLNSNIPVLVDFWASWCRPCLAMAPVIEEMAETYKGRLKVCKLNVDESQETAIEYGIMSIPTLTIFKNGEVVDSITGVTSKETLQVKINSCL